MGQKQVIVHAHVQGTPKAGLEFSVGVVNIIFLLLKGSLLAGKV